VLTESELIAFISRGRAGAPARKGDLGIGDDCAVLKVGARSLLVTVDLMAEGVHFDLAYTPPYLLGRKAVAASLSDIAAMGGTPRGVFVSAALPAKTKPAFARALVEGIHEEARAAGAAVLGGDTSSSMHRIFLDVVAIGEASRRGPILRRGARAGDAIYVSGTLGASARGLELLRKGFRPWSRRLWSRSLLVRGREADRRRDELVAALAHLLPRPRLALGRALGVQGLPSAMIDVSDGLAIDLHRLCDASRVGASIELARIPVDSAAAAGRPGRAPALALGGGEDYELLFTAPARAERRLMAIAERLREPLARIGRITPARRGVVLVDGSGRRRPLPRAGFEHFRSATRTT
jgi:thiamine-monophosphate kinase